MSSETKVAATNVELFLPGRRRLVLTLRGRGLELLRTATVRTATSPA
ncbi:MAG: hypothetical protein HYZ38_20875 [Mycobacterium sp.]|nr:hypothetical protein [Mycobacterium sp.]